MVMTNTQRRQLTAYIMSPIIFLGLMNLQLYKKQDQVITLQSGKSRRIQNTIRWLKTRRLVELPPGRKAVGCKWVFTPETLLRWCSGTIQSTPSGQGLNPEIWYRLWWNLFARSSYLSNTLFASVCSSEWFADSPDGRRNSFSQR